MRNIIIGIGLLLLVGGVVGFFYLKHRNTKEIKFEIPYDEFDIVYGDLNAQNTIVMFVNYDCIHCRKFLTNVFPLIQHKFIDRGTCKFVLKPLCFSSDPKVKDALKTAVCLNKHGDFTELQNLFLLEPMAKYSDNFQELLQNYLDRNSLFAECYLSNATELYLAKNIKMFLAIATKQTPTFVINNRIYKGNYTYGKISSYLSKIEKTNKK